MGHFFVVWSLKNVSKHFLQQKWLHFGHDIGSVAGDKHIKQFTKSNTLWERFLFNV